MDTKPPLTHVSQKYVHKRLNNQSIKIVDKYKELSISIADNVQAEAQKAKSRDLT